MKKYSIRIIVLLLLIEATSCSKSFLDVPDKTTLLRQAYVTDLKTTEDYLNGIYVEFSANFYKGLFLIYSDLVSDNIKATSSYLTTQYNWKQQADDDKSVGLFQTRPNENGLWLSGYRLIRDCDFILEVTDKYRKENPSQADNIKGQAYALRALAHFAMVNTFSQAYNYTTDASHPGIPYVTSSDWRAPVSRQTVAEVYSHLIADLNKAIELLPVEIKDTRYMNRAAAKALLARVYLFKADYTAAKNLAREIGNQSPLVSVDNGYPNALYSLLEPSQTESLFQLSPTLLSSATGGTYNTFFEGYYFYTTVRFTATADIATLLTENPLDKRSGWVVKTGANWNIRKFPANVVSGFPSPGSRGYYETIIRSSEMFLTAAECYAQLNNEDSARYYLDAIRLRADPSVAISTATGPALLDSIYKERRKELAFEGLRMSDLLRWKKGVTRNDAPNADAKTLPYPSDKAIAPLPVSDVLLSGLSQNPGY